MWSKIINRQTQEEKSAPENRQEICEMLKDCRLPRHTAIIMDGNGRWAKAKGLLRTAGHSVGVNTLKDILMTAIDLNLEVLTVYAFSTENWRRPAAEVDFLMNLFYDYLKAQIAEMKKNNVKLRFIGRVGELPERLKNLAAEAVAELEENTGVTLCVAMNYGGQDELLRAVRKIATNAVKGEIVPENIQPDDIEAALDTAGLPPVDLVIRTSGDMRLSNFLIWQTAYAEFYSSAKNWPDFSPADFAQALLDYSKRERRFGGLKNRI